MDPDRKLSDAEQDALAERIQAGFRRQFKDMAEVKREIEARKNRALALRMILVVIVFSAVGAGLAWALGHLTI